MPEPPGTEPLNEGLPAAADERPAEPAAQTTATYVARRLVVERGYTPGVPVEAAPFAARCDLALTYTDGVSFVLVGIIDRENGLAEEEILRTSFPGTQIEPVLRAALGELLLNGGREAEAKELLRPVCAMNARPEIADWVKSTGACGASSPDPP